MYRDITYQCGRKALARGHARARALLWPVLVWPVLLWPVLLLLACSSRSHSPLPRLEVPADLKPGEETLFLRAHMEQYIRSIEAGDDVHFDYEKHVRKQFLYLTRDLAEWDYAESVGEKWMDYELKQSMLARTPGAARFRGARQRAVALGLLALAIWRRNPPLQDPTIEQMTECTRYFAEEVRCRVGPRARSLKRMMLMGEYADRQLWNRLSKPPGDDTHGE